MKTNKILFPIFIFAILHLGCREETYSSKEQSTSAENNTALKKPTNSARTEIYSPEKELAGFKVPEGFVIELVASERDGIVNPIDLTFDDAGRLWTQTAEMYPLDPVVDMYVNGGGISFMENPEAQEKDPNFKRVLDLYRGKTKGLDKILVLSNLYSGGKAKTSVWADGLAIPQSILPYKNGSYVLQGSELFFLDDTDKDGKADKRTPLFTGFGYTDTHTMAHTMVRGPGDWIHFSHGALNKGEVSSLVNNTKMRMDYSKIGRFSLDAKKMELVNAGLNNIWGFQLRANGQWFGCEANDMGYSVAPMEAGTAYPGIGNQRLRSYQPFMPVLHEFRVGGTGISGLAFADDLEGSFPKAWKDVALLANPITSTINAVKIIRNVDGSVSAEHLPDLLSSEDDWFRPVNIEFGPDGCLYIADWYNKIVSHNEVATSHPDRDKTHGRIWRIRHKSQKPQKIINFYEVQTENLVGFLKSQSIWAKRAAWHQISDRPIDKTKKLANGLIDLAGDNSQEAVTRIMALWSLEAIHHYDKNLIADLLSAPDTDLRREAIRSLASFSLKTDDLANLLKNPASDSNPMVRAQVLRTLEKVGNANTAIIDLLVEACKPELYGDAMGGAYERKFERYLARKALENYPEELSDYISSPMARKQPTTNLVWASQALPKQQRERVFLDLWKKAGYKELDRPTFIIVANMLSNVEILKKVKPVLEQTDKAEAHVSLALKNLGQVRSDQLARLLKKPIKYLLRSKEESLQYLGLEAVGKLKVDNVREAVVALIKENSTPETLSLILLALENEPKQNKAVFARLADNESLNATLRISALNTLVKVDQSAASTILNKWLPKLNEPQRKSITKVLSNSKEGAVILKQSVEKESLTHKAFDISSAEKVYQANKKDPRGLALLNEVKKQLEEDKKAFDTKLQQFMAIVEKADGNADKGEKLFQTCLLCHSVGDKGQNIAPALDGSSLRENEALLTAILDPDAAMESSYATFRITKKDGSSIEGYLVQGDNRGTTIASMGGSTLFVPFSEIKIQGFQKGNSFMMKGLIDHYSDEQVSDLFSYIRTLK